VVDLLEMQAKCFACQLRPIGLINHS
jgi:hypothetical protein